MAEAPVRIENRAQLVYVLSEACELEHGLSCSYQFAAFSLKSSTDEGVTGEQLKAIKRWKRTILNIAIDEMFHLGHACNLLTSVGGAPHLRRPNLPASPRMYPPGFVLALTPFSDDTLSRFVFTERPEGMGQDDGDAPAPKYRSHPLDRPADIFPGGQVYETVGHLYRAVEDGLRYLVDKYGEDGLFVSADSQSSAFGLGSAVDLASAIGAIEEIVEQGEGARGDVENAHYGMFLGVLNEYRELKKQDPNFEPARPVLANPYSRVPGDIHPSVEVGLVDGPMSTAVCNLFDGCYALLVLVLGRMFAHNEESDTELEALAEVTRRLMMNVVSPLGSLVTSLPAGPSSPGYNAGPSFHMLRDSHTLPHKGSALTLFRERIRELWAYCGLLETFDDPPKGLARITKGLGELKERLPVGA
ncbi:MAG: ferritin-like domain-containing protein [Dehalococcoidia bacterium]